MAPAQRAPRNHAFQAGAGSAVVAVLGSDERGSLVGCSCTAAAGPAPRSPPPPIPGSPPVVEELALRAPLETTRWRPPGPAAVAVCLAVTTTGRWLVALGRRLPGLLRGRLPPPPDRSPGGWRGASRSERLETTSGGRGVRCGCVPGRDEQESLRGLLLWYGGCRVCFALRPVAVVVSGPRNRSEIFFDCCPTRWDKHGLSRRDCRWLLIGLDL